MINVLIKVDMINLQNTVDPFKNATPKKCDPRGVSQKCYTKYVKMRPQDPGSVYAY